MYWMCQKKVSMHIVAITLLRRVEVLMKLHLRATGCHLPYGITQCYLSAGTSERATPNLSQTGWYWIYLPRKDGRLSTEMVYLSAVTSK